MTRPRVLIVDDESLIRWSLREHLLGAGYQVVDAATGADALARVSPDVALALVDYHLPDVDGIELIQQIRERAPGCRFFLISAELDPALARRAKDAGCLRAIEKPFQLDRVGRWVNQTLRQAKEAI